MDYENVTIVAIDPGKSGGIATYAKGKIHAGKMGTIQEVKLYLDYVNNTYENIIVFIEKVQAYRGKEDDAPGKKFGINKMLKNYTQLVTCITLMGLHFIEVYPISWQSKLGLSFRGQKLTKTERKNKYKIYAGNCFPEIPKVTLNIADALCICQFALIKLKDDHLWIDDKLQNRDRPALL